MNNHCITCYLELTCGQQGHCYICYVDYLERSEKKFDKEIDYGRYDFFTE